MIPQQHTSMMMDLMFQPQHQACHHFSPLSLVATLKNLSPHSHYPALLGKHQRPRGWCTLWRRRIRGRRVMGARRGRCTLPPRCSWKTSRRDTSLNKGTSVKPRRARTSIRLLDQFHKPPCCSPKSISSRAALAPSTRIFLLGPVRALCMKYTPSVTRGRSLSA